MKCNKMAQYVLAMNEHIGGNLKNVPLKVVLETVCNMDASADPEVVGEELLFVLNRWREKVLNFSNVLIKSRPST